MKETTHYTIEKYPHRKQWSLNRYDATRNEYIPVAYFTNEVFAKVAREELAK